MNDAKVTITRATTDHVLGIVKVHQQAFPGFYLTLMGPRFLREYYSSVLSYPESVFYVGLRNDMVVGFICGFLNPNAFYEYFRAKRKHLMPLILMRILRHPSLLWRTLHNMRRIQIPKSITTNIELSSIAVIVPGGGLGSQLLTKFMVAAQATTAIMVVLTTDADNNGNVNRFYQKHGFVLKRSFQDGKRPMNEYNLELKRS